MDHIQFFFASGTWWLYILLLSVCGGVAWLTYQRTVPTISGQLRWLLTSLRTVGMALLLIALFEPILRSVRSEELRPQVFIAIDASSSMNLANAKGTRPEQLRTALKAVQTEVPDAPMVVFSDVTNDLLVVDSLKLTGHRTDMEQLVRNLSNRRGTERPGVVIAITDGNVNSGASPLYDAEQSGMGWYTIGIGDTSVPGDVAVLSLLAGDLAVVGRTTTVSASIQSIGFADSSIIVALFEEQTEVARDTIHPVAARDRSMANIAWTPRVAGHRKLSIRATVNGKEATLANNSRSEYVEVRSDQRTVTVFAGAPSSDLSFITTQLERSPNLKVRVIIQKQGATFYSPLPSVADLVSSQACILVGFPLPSTPLDVVQRIAQACDKGLSLLFIASRETDYTKLRPLEPYLPFSVVSSRPTEFLATADVSPSATADPLLRIDGTDEDAKTWNSLPPIYRTETYVQPAAGAEVMATIRVNNVPVPEPLIIRRTTGSTRSVAILGYGLYRWTLMGMGPAASRGEHTPDVLGAFIGNSVSWLAVDEADKRVSIVPTRKFYDAGEAVALQASVLDEAFVPADGAEVRVRISGPTGKREIVLGGLGGGRYSSIVGPLPAGDYQYSGTVTQKGRGLGADAGRFTVGDLGLEESGIMQNVELLAALSERTGATYGLADRAKEIAQAAKADARRRPRAVTSERDQAIWQSYWPLLIAISAFAIEWLLRKRSGLV